MLRVILSWFIGLVRTVRLFGMHLQFAFNFTIFSEIIPKQISKKTRKMRKCFGSFSIFSFFHYNLVFVSSHQESTFNVNRNITVSLICLGPNFQEDTCLEET